MTQKKTKIKQSACDVMAFGAHPDDLEIGAGGTLAAMVQAGMKVVLVDVTDGEPTPRGNHALRLREASQAAKILKISKRLTLNISNREIFDTVPNRIKLATLIRQYRPTLVLGPYWEDGHPDHVELAKLVVASCFYAKFVKTSMPFEAHKPRRILHYFSLHIHAKFSPSFVFDVSKYIEPKMKAIGAYRSQFITNKINSGVLNAIRIESAYWGQQIGVKFGEPFISREHLCLTKPESLLSV